MSEYTFDQAIADARAKGGLKVQGAPKQKIPKPKTFEDLGEAIIHQLRQVYDPEIPVNLYDLGLIYAIDVHSETWEVKIEMTLTAPNCPVAGDIPPAVQEAVLMIEGVPSVDVTLVWDPPWRKDMMSEAAALELGFM